jgi:hypothetical protein
LPASGSCRPWKLSAEIELMRPQSMGLYARLCGWTLARAHARSGDRIAGGIDWIRHILQIGAAAVLIAIVAPRWMRRGTGPAR